MFQFSSIGRQTWDTVVIGLAIVTLEIGDTVGLRFSIREWLAARPAIVRWTAYYLFVLGICIGGQFNGPPFIYFQF
jgi:hypothetical protein